MGGSAYISQLIRNHDHPKMNLVCSQPLGVGFRSVSIIRSKPSDVYSHSIHFFEDHGSISMTKKKLSQSQN